MSNMHIFRDDNCEMDLCIVDGRVSIAVRDLDDVREVLTQNILTLDKGDVRELISLLKKLENELIDEIERTL